MSEGTCAHCESRAASTAEGLCRACDAVEGVRDLYERRRGWTPEWDRHLAGLAARARARLPLFGPTVDNAALPPHTKS